MKKYLVDYTLWFVGSIIWLGSILYDFVDSTVGIFIFVIFMTIAFIFGEARKRMNKIQKVIYIIVVSYFFIINLIELMNIE